MGARPAWLVSLLKVTAAKHKKWVCLEVSRVSPRVLIRGARFCSGFLVAKLAAICRSGGGRLEVGGGGLRRGSSGF